MSLQSSNNGAALLQNLKVLDTFLSDESNTEIVVNKPGEVLTEGINGWQQYNVEALDYNRCHDIASLTAAYSGQKLNENSPILSATLPHGERIQIVINPATIKGRVSFTIRKPSDRSFTLQDYRDQGFFDTFADFKEGLDNVEVELGELLKKRKFEEFFKLAVNSRKNIVISGSTGSGKTTMMKTLIDLVPSYERLISIENVDEVKIYKKFKNSVPLFYSATNTGVSAGLTQQHLLESSLRMRPDRIFLAELIRGDEAFYYLRNVNSGHPGSITSIHANSARLAIEQLVLFMKESRSGNSMSRDEIKQLIFMCVDIIVQVNNVGGKRSLTEIYYDPKNKRKHIN
jgi:type IV secretion system protein VirB11